MKFQSEVTVLGMKASKGSFEGTDYDSTKVYVLTDLDASKGTAIGQSAAEYVLGKSDEYDKYKHLPFPVKGIGELEIVTNGKTQKTVMHAFRPTDRAPSSVKGQ
jgi:5S rRNA maturation endonuclease (ribonuclease M5)